MVERPTILGGETPFFAAADAPFVYPAEIRHKPLRVAIEGVEQTRALSCVMLGMMQQMARADYADPAELREFMEGAIAGANTDLRASGLGPLISFDEVDAYEAHLVKRGVFEGGEHG